MTRLLEIALILILNFFVLAQPGEHFTELRGLDDRNENTHLFYRIFRPFDPPSNYHYDNHIYRWNLQTGEDVVFLESFFHPCSVDVGVGKVIRDFDFWHNNFSNYVAGGFDFHCTGGLDPIGSVFLPSHSEIISHGTVNNVAISHQDSLLMYISSFDVFAKSIDGGYTWETISNEYGLAGISPFDDQLILAFYYHPNNGDMRLSKSSNGGSSFSEVYPKNFPKQFMDPRLFYFDPDTAHIYAILDDTLFVSADTGNSWENREIRNDFLELDRDVSGNFFAVNANEIYHSSDFGATFSLYRALPGSVIGLYKKPAQNTLYAATRFKIYQVTSSDTTVIKSLPIVGIETEPVTVVAGFALYQNYPNPFNPSTTITFELPQAEEIELSVFDLSGRKIVTLAQGRYPMGVYEEIFSVKNLPSGVYFYRIRTKTGILLSRKMLLLK